MIAAPKTPKRVAPTNLHGLYTPKFGVSQKRGPMPMAHFNYAALTLSQHISHEKQAHRPVSTPARIPFRMFEPEHTSTPASIPSRETPHKNRNVPKHQNAKEIRRLLVSIPDNDEDEEHEELCLDAPSPIPFSPEPRPSSAPISKRALFQTEIPPRPLTTEPVEHKQAKTSIRSPSRKRIVQKTTYSKTPRCARPTISWLNRINYKGDK